MCMVRSLGSPLDAFDTLVHQCLYVSDTGANFGDIIANLTCPRG